MSVGPNQAKTPYSILSVSSHVHTWDVGVSIKTMEEIGEDLLESV